MVQTKFRVRITVKKIRRHGESSREDLASRICDVMEDTIAATAAGKTKVFLQCG